METTEDLARRAVRAKHWRWMPGMRNALDGSRYMGDERWARVWNDTYLHQTRKGSWPDLDDPATLGCLLALVREAYDQPLAFCRYVEANPAFWHINTGHVGATEAEALAAALEAAP